MTHHIGPSTVAAGVSVLGAGGYQAINQLGAALREAKDYYDSQWEHVGEDIPYNSGRSSGSHENASRNQNVGTGRSRGGGGVIRANKSDLAFKPPGNKVPKIPRSLRNQIVWLSGSMELSVITWSTSSVVETNYSFILQNLPSYGSAVSLFDQYYIAEATISFFSGYPPGATGTPPKLYTAIDYDNSASVGTVAAIEAYASCKIVDFTVGKVVTRTVCPCVKTTVSNVASAGVNRSWIDCSQATINHFGIRSIFGISGSSYTCQPTLQLIIAFRNVI